MTKNGQRIAEKTTTVNNKIRHKWMLQNKLLIQHKNIQDQGSEQDTERK